MVLMQRSGILSTWVVNPVWKKRHFMNHSSELGCENADVGIGVASP